MTSDGMIHGLANLEGAIIFLSEAVWGMLPSTLATPHLLTETELERGELTRWYEVVSLLARGLQRKASVQLTDQNRQLWSVTLWLQPVHDQKTIGVLWRPVNSDSESEMELFARRGHEVVAELLQLSRHQLDASFYDRALGYLWREVGASAAGLYLGPENTTATLQIASGQNGDAERLPHTLAARFRREHRVTVRYTVDLNLPGRWRSLAPTLIWIPFWSERRPVGGLIITAQSPLGWARLKLIRQIGDLLELFVLPDTLQYRLQTARSVRQALLEAFPGSVAVVDSRAVVLQANHHWRASWPGVGESILPIGKRFQRPGWWTQWRRSEHPLILEDAQARRGARLRLTATRVGEPPADRSLILIEEVGRTVSKHSLDEMKDVFVAHVSHELRSPLAVLKGHLSLLEKEAPVSQADSWRAIDHHLHRLERLVADILDLAELQYGQVSFTCREIDVASLFARVKETGKSLGVTVVGSTAVPWVHNDPDRLEQILSNLVQNAAKHSPPGSTVWLSASLLDDDRVQLEVRDEGEGIAVADIPHIFDRFYKGNDLAAGAGLGLAIVHALVTHVGGTVSVVSKKGQGSCFSIIIPRIVRR